MTPPFQEDAEAHWKWLETLLHKVYVDAMVHGFKHGYDQGFVAGAFESDLNPNQIEREAAQRGGENNGEKAKN